MFDIDPKHTQGLGDLQQDFTGCSGRECGSVQVAGVCPELGASGKGVGCLGREIRGRGPVFVRLVFDPREEVGALGPFG